MAGDGPATGPGLGKGLFPIVVDRAFIGFDDRWNTKFLDSTVWILSSCEDLSSRDSTLLGPQQRRELHKPRVREKTQDSRACTTWHTGRGNISWHQNADTSNAETKKRQGSLLYVGSKQGCSAWIKVALQQQSPQWHKENTDANVWGTRTKPWGQVEKHGF